MPNTVIGVDRISKLYRIGASSQRADGLRHALESGLKAFGRKLWGRAESNPSESDFWALKDVSFEVKQGECIGVIGRNGAGKSTLLKILSRITEPSSGEVRLRGRVGSLLEVGTGFHAELSGRENIYLNGAILGMSKKEIARKFDEIVAFSEVEKFLHTPVKRYSSGMYVRLAFAVAAHLDPEILIVDEVLAVGDHEFQKKCLGKMNEVAGAGRTVLFVSHNMSTVRSLCTSCCVLAKGEVAFFGPTDEATDLYMRSSGGGTPSAARRFDQPAGAPAPWMKSVALSSAGVAVRSIKVGDPLELLVTFARPSPIRHPNFWFAISDERGQPLVHANTRFAGGVRRDQNSDGDGTIRCDLGVLPFVPGRYFVSVAVGDLFARTHDEPDAISFEVTENSIWETGRSPTNYAPLWWPTEFVVSG